jgi:hypothetical protein
LNDYEPLNASNKSLRFQALLFVQLALVVTHFPPNCYHDDSDVIRVNARYHHHDHQHHHESDNATRQFHASICNMSHSGSESIEVTPARKF